MATRHYRAHVTKNPKDFDIWVQLGHAYKETGRLKEADAAYEAANGLDGSDADLMLCRGHLAKLMDDPRAAADYYSKSFAIDSNPAAARELAQITAADEWVAPSEILGVAGAVDGFGDALIGGWVVDPRQPDVPAEVEILIHGKVVARAVGDIDRHDVVQAGLGRRNVGFLLDLSGILDLSRPTELHARVAGSHTPLAASPMTVEVDERHRHWSRRWKPASSKITKALIARVREEAPHATLSIIVPLSRENALSVDLIDSLQSQWLDQWEVLLVPTDGRNAQLSRAAEKRIAEDGRFRVMPAGDGGLAGALKRAVTGVGSDHVLFVESNAALEPEAVWRILDVCSRGADLVYWDEARIGRSVEGIERFVVRSALSIDHLRAYPQLIGSFVVSRTTALAVLSDTTRKASESMDGIRLDLAERARMAAHVPTVLERRRGLVPEERRPASARATRTGTGKDPATRTLIVVAPVLELDLLRRTVQALLASTGRTETDLLIISRAKRTRATQRYLDGLSGVAKVHTCDDASAMGQAINDAVQAMAGNYSHLVLVHAPVTPAVGWLQPLLERLSRPEVGVAAPILVSPDGRVLSAGVSVTAASLLQSHHGVPLTTSRGRSLGWNRSLVSLREQSGAYGCLALRMVDFLGVGGIDPVMPLTTAFTDLCLRLALTGRRTLIDPWAVVRTCKVVPDGRLDTTFRARWASLIAEGDPFLSPALADDLRLVRLDTTFIPARRRAINPPLLAASVGRITLLGTGSRKGSDAL